MKFNNFLIAFALSIAIQPFTSLSSAVPQETQQDQQSQSYYQQYAPQFMQDITSYISKKYEDTVGKWTVEKRLAVAGAIIATLAALYNSEQIIQWIHDITKAQLLEESINKAQKSRAEAWERYDMDEVRRQERILNKLYSKRSPRQTIRI